MSDAFDEPIPVLLVEDNPGDVRLTQEALKEGSVPVDLFVAEDGAQALDFLHRRPPFADAPRPALILLDLNLPRMNGREVLALIKGDDRFRSIPVVVLTSSEAEKDIAEAYHYYANCFITKPVSFEKFMDVVKSIGGFWFHTVKLPRDERDAV
ncbi:MAG: response regulator [Deltaproteobacteria bacterium]|nr:response regulator [Deltaproteobacteria bacterium]